MKLVTSLVLTGEALERFLADAPEPCHHGLIQTTFVEDRATVRWYVTRCDHCGATLDVHDEAQERERVLETLFRPPARPGPWFVSPAQFRQLVEQERLSRRVAYVASPHARPRAIDTINVKTESNTTCTIRLEPAEG